MISGWKYSHAKGTYFGQAICKCLVGTNKNRVITKTSYLQLKSAQSSEKLDCKMVRATAVAPALGVNQRYVAMHIVSVVYNTPTDIKQSSKAFFRLFICRFLMKVMGKAASEKSTQADTTSGYGINGVRHHMIQGTYLH